MRSHTRRIALVLILHAGVALTAVSPAGATAPPRTGQLPERLIHAFEDGLFQLPAPFDGLGTSSASTALRIPIILASYSDSALHYSAKNFEFTLFDTTGSTPTGSVYDYYRWVSGGRVTVLGTVVATVRLPGDRHYYGADSWGMSYLSTPNNSYGAVRDALTLTRGMGIDWSEFDRDRNGYVDMLWLIHAGIGGEGARELDDLWSITANMSLRWRNGTYFETEDPDPGSPGDRMKVERFTILPELSALSPGAISEIGVFCHEFGHALGLPDLYATTTLTNVRNVGPGNWSLMASGGWGTDGLSPQYPAHLGAWPLQRLGWDHTIRPSDDTTLVLEPIGRNGQIVELSFQGESSPEHFLIENRQREGFDRRLVREGLLIYHIDAGVVDQHTSTNTVNNGPNPGLWLVEADGDSDLVTGRNRGDPNDPFPGASGITSIDDYGQPNMRRFDDAVTNLAVLNIASVDGGMRFTAQVRAPGWLPAEDFTGSQFEPLGFNGFARVSAVDDRGEGHWVASEVRSGVPQIVLRSGGISWNDAFQVSHSTRAALDPTVAALPGGDLAIAWSDHRNGPAQLYYRSRIRGVWTPERRLLGLPGDCRNPTIGADDRGTLSLVFQYFEGGIPQIRFMRFTYFSPFGQTFRVSAPGSRPGSPGLAVSRDGVAYLFWGEAAQAPQRLWFSRYHRDSGLAAPLPLTLPSSKAQLGLTALVDQSGTLHAVWHESGPGSNQLHYQRRPRGGVPAPEDTLIETRGSLMQNPVLAADPNGGLHLVFEAERSGLVQVLYRRWQPGYGWDSGSTEVTRSEDGVASSPQPLPVSRDELSVAYAGFATGGARFMVRRRSLSSLTLSVRPARIAAPVGLTLGPNPLRAGNRLEVSYSGPADRGLSVEFFDLSGRRVATAALELHGERWRSQLSDQATRSWASGVYFARVKGQSTGARRLIVIR